MRVLFFGNNRLAVRVAAWLRAQAEEIVGVVIHPPERCRHTGELVRVTGVPDGRVFDASTLADPAYVASLAELRPDIGVSVLFGYILRPAVLQLLPLGCVNLHPALLPHNRGAYPNVWSIVDGTPAGATVHYMDAGVDTGDIIVQREVRVEPVDTGETLYRKLEDCAFAVFVEAWPLVRAGGAPRVPQDPFEGSEHRVRDVERIDHIELDRLYTARELLNTLRARTFPPFASAYFMSGGRRVEVRVQLSYADHAPRAGDETREQVPRVPRRERDGQYLA